MSAEPLLTLEHTVFVSGGRALSLELFPGEAYAIVGPALSGRARLFQVLCGDVKPVSGSHKFRVEPDRPWDKDFTKRHTPQGLSKSIAKRASSSRLTQVLSALGLWDVRHEAVVNLPEELVAACELLPVFLGDSSLALIDGQLDKLDLWTRETALAQIQEMRQTGKAFLVSTNLLKVAQSMGWIVLVSGSSPAFAGPISELLRASAPTELIIETDDPSSVATMVEPFSVSVAVIPGGLKIQADKGQELAARLLTEGYGKVRAVLVKEPELAEILRGLV